MSFVIYVFMLFVSFVSVGGVSLFFLVCFAVSSMSLVSLFANIITHPHNLKNFFGLCGCRWGEGVGVIIFLQTQTTKLHQST